MESAARPSLGAILGVFLRLGMASFGGGLPGWMHHEVVRKRGWLDEERFMAGLALGQVLPGPNSVNLALHIGQQLRGWPGAAAAFLGILGPPFLFILVLARRRRRAFRIGNGRARRWAGWRRRGWRTVARSARCAARRVRGFGLWAVAAATFVAVGMLRLPMIPVVLALAPIGIGLAWREGRDAGGR